MTRLVAIILSQFHLNYNDLAHIYGTETFKFLTSSLLLSSAHHFIRSHFGGTVIRYMSKTKQMCLLLCVLDFLILFLFLLLFLVKKKNIKKCKFIIHIPHSYNLPLVLFFLFVLFLSPLRSLKFIYPFVGYDE